MCKALNKIMAKEYCLLLERDTMQFGKQITFLMTVLLSTRHAESAGSALVRKDGKGKDKTIPLQAWTGT